MRFADHSRIVGLHGASCHPSGFQNLEAVPRLLENSLTLDLIWFYCHTCSLHLYQTFTVRRRQVMNTWTAVLYNTVRSESRCALIKTRSSIERTIVSKNWIKQLHTLPVLHYNRCLTLNILSLARQRCLPSWGPRRIPWFFFCNFSTVWCGRLLKLCFLDFWNYNSVIHALLA
jgi:hypothetical protein